MRKLDRLPWADAFVAAGHGARVGIRVNDPSLLPQLRQRLPPGVGIGKPGVVDRMLSIWSPGVPSGRHGRQYFVIYADHVRGGRAAELEPVLDAFDTHLRLAIAQFARPGLFVHAGAVAWGGTGVIFPGPSLSGKSHLVAALVRAGAVYYSDEYAVLDPAGDLHPFPKPVSLREDKTSRQRDVAISELGGKVAQDRVPVGLIVLCRYEAGAGWAPQRLSYGQAMLGLLENAFSARQRPHDAMDILGRTVGRSVTLACARGDADRIVTRIFREVESVAQGGVI